ncbi:MAG: hypothetical protein PHC84_01005 [Clostridia bacterium]|nr:hypothetical protein [Clostridia bacterium]
MRKIILILFLTCFVFVVYGCKPAMPSGLYAYVELLERTKLRGLTTDFFVEVTLLKQHSRELCRLTLIPSRLGYENITVGYEYGEAKGAFQKDATSLEYTAEVDYCKTHSSITLITERRETVPLIPVAQTPVDELLSKAYGHFEERIRANISQKKFLQRIQIKILADMHANAFFYVGFIGNDDYYAAVFDTVSLELIADYYK